MWEYKVIKDDSLYSCEIEINKLGLEGWEVVAMAIRTLPMSATYFFTLKRPK